MRLRFPQPLMGTALWRYIMHFEAAIDDAVRGFADRLTNSESMVSLVHRTSRSETAPGEMMAPEFEIVETTDTGSIKAQALATTTHTPVRFSEQQSAIGKEVVQGTGNILVIARQVDAELRLRRAQDHLLNLIKKLKYTPEMLVGVTEEDLDSLTRLVEGVRINPLDHLSGLHKLITPHH